MSAQHLAYAPGSFNIVSLNEGQAAALDEIMARARYGNRHLLTGHAGTGKTTLMQAVARELLRRGMKTVLTAPTHKAVSVLARKAREADLEIESRTIQSLLSLRPRRDGPVMKFQRAKRARTITCDAVVLDECSMVDRDMHGLIEKHLNAQFILFVGDPAQLPPVNEDASPTFSIPQSSHLDRIVRQAEGNPILKAASIIRESQGGALDMSWVKSVKAPPLGVFRPGDPEAWMKKAFTSLDFDQDPDRFRYLCWTNDRVTEVNAMIRAWRYGCDIETPFVAGERALMRQPVLGPAERNPFTRETDRPTLLNTNEEAEIEYIRPHLLQGVLGDGITYDLPAWKIGLVTDDGVQIEVHVARDQEACDAMMSRLRQAAMERLIEWTEYHDLRSDIVSMQSVYAMTVHCSQGSTFGSVFMDVGDIARRARSNLLECQQMLYVAATRPSTSLILV